MKKTPDFDAAAGFLTAGARVLDRRVFQRLFSGGAAEPVRDAVAAYRNADGGFGHALEPDLRTPASQPAAASKSGVFFMRPSHQDCPPGVLNETATRAGRTASAARCSRAAGRPPGRPGLGTWLT